MRLTIRDGTAGDAPWLATLLEQLGHPASAQDIARRLELLRSSDADRVIVAEADGTVVALASLRLSVSIEFDQPGAELRTVVVDERHRRLGVGAALVSELEAEARRRGCAVLFPTSAGHRADADAFYRRIGFEERGKRFVKSLT
jgi:N-acetylglutamate synthase-like GNAT family acetyltransferase